MNPDKASPTSADDQAAEQAGNRDTRAAYQGDAAEEDTGHEDGQDPARDPVAAAEPVVDGHRGVQADTAGRERDHRPHTGGGPTPRWQHERGGDAAEREAHPPDPVLDVAEFAEHSLTPLGALRGQQADRPARQPQRRVFGRSVQEPLRIAPVPRDQNAQQADHRDKEQATHYASLQRLRGCGNAPVDARGGQRRHELSTGRGQSV